MVTKYYINDNIIYFIHYDRRRGIQINERYVNDNITLPSKI